MCSQRPNHCLGSLLSSVQTPEGSASARSCCSAVPGWPVGRLHLLFEKLAVSMSHALQMPLSKNMGSIHGHQVGSEQSS